MGPDRRAFLHRVRAALGRGDAPAIAPPPKPPPAIDDELLRLAGPGDDLLARFEEGARAVGMHVRKTTSAALADALLDLLRGLPARRVALAAEERAAVAEALREAGVEVVDHADGFAALYDGVEAGITDVAAALAETGTLVLHTSGFQGRGPSLVPPHHVALVRRSDLLPDMIDYWRAGKGVPSRDRPACRVFVTGPSKTADIEGELVQGVHGPAEVHILLVADA